ncbi:hypothetical protein J113_05345 [Mycobacterium tuberculosis CAS/NITR204]|uniref:Uncharacterized protein n=1 Tax=Mycobacterium tuberculosis CAS/NITR204 TaxID=1310114 RepID=R4ME53_MYCTX|nr:hypothetical protein J113_05345 [Mycobacterium tuberculosis CAS/NITR204]
MNLGQTLVGMRPGPRGRVAAADTGLNMAGAAVDMAKQALGDAGGASGSTSMANMLGIDDTIARANRLARLLDDDMPLGRAIAPNGPMDRMLRPGGVVDLLTQPGGLLDRLTAEGGAMQRPPPGGLADQLLAEDGLIERVLSEDGLADRLLAEGGLIDKITAKDLILEQLADVADAARLTPGMEALEPAIATLQDAVIALTMVVNPLSSIAERIPLPGRRPARRSSSRSVRSQRVVDSE